MKSMTGYGKGEITESGRTLCVELKSVNHRFLDLSIKLPKQFNFAEDTIRKTLQNAFSRGHIDVFVTYEDKSSERQKLTLDRAVAENYILVARLLEIELGIENDLTASTLMRFNDVIVENKTEAGEAVLSALLQKGLKDAVDKLGAMREKEGKAVRADFECRIKVVKELLATITARAPEIVLMYREKLMQRIKEAIKDVTFDEARLINEVAYFTDRANIDEEITRLGSHIQQFSELVDLGEPVGRKLDFLLQEMNREVNTMGSKANDSQLLTCVVELKTELEKLREQIQNIE
ncbi:MAG: YicC family protein [Clostridia bacterium]|nr:YicC family protein [Clostridia bacterium]